MDSNKNTALYLKKEGRLGLGVIKQQLSQPMDQSQEMGQGGGKSSQTWYDYPLAIQ